MKEWASLLAWLWLQMPRGKVGGGVWWEEEQNVELKV